MTLKAGTRLGTFEILDPLGAGGMGEVYRARDLKLGREVAIKVLPSVRSTDPVARGRFEREARAVATLNHPNVLAIYEFGTHEGIAYAVMELLKGRTLRSILQEGPLPMPRAVGFGIQIGNGLAAAHEKGIIHRDLKPENILITPDDRVKILDFGLAKSSASNTSVDTNLPTEAEYTDPGTVMGTAGYMSPEQVRGEAVDHRSDLFSLGAVFYELITAQRAFSRSTNAETMTSILREEPPPVPEGAGVSPAYLRIIQHCLEKDPEKRFRTAHDLVFALETLTISYPVTIAPEPARSGRTRILLLLIALLTVGLVGSRFLRARPAATPSLLGSATIMQLTIDPGYEGEPTFSPDGQTIAYVSDREGNFEIYLQQVSGGEPINLTRNESSDIQPAFSRDGRQIAFVSNRSGSSDIFAAAPQLPLVGGDIWIMPALGGPPRRIVENGNFPSWSPDGRWIVYTHGTFKQSRIAVVPSEGGVSRDLELGNLEVQRLFYPTYSEDGKWILFQNSGDIYAVESAGGTPAFLVAGGNPCWGPGSRSILYTSNEPGKNGTLWETGFSMETGKITGEPRAITFGRGIDTGAIISPDGRSIVFSAQDTTLNLEELPFDAEQGQVTGQPRELTKGTNRVSFFTSAPDANSVVFAASRGATSHLWRLDSNQYPTQLTLDPDYQETNPDWSPDGKRIAFGRSKLNGDEKDSEIWLISPDGASPRRLIEAAAFTRWLDSTQILAQMGTQLAIVDADTSAVTKLPIQVRTLYAVDRKGEWIAYQTGDKGNIDLAAVPVSGGEPRVIVSTPHEDHHPSFSPSGNWLYFQENHKNMFRVPGPAQNWRHAPPEKVTHFQEGGLYLEDPQIAPTGTKIFYTRGRIIGDLYLLQLSSQIPH